MQENKFEKDIRQKLDELHLSPSAPVWQNIEASIKKDRKRRLVLWLLPLLAVSTGIALWHLSGLHVDSPAPQTASHKISTSPQNETFSKPHSASTKELTATQQHKSSSTVSTPNALKQTALEKEQQPLANTVLQKKQTHSGAVVQPANTQKNTAKNTTISAYADTKSFDEPALNHQAGTISLDATPPHTPEVDLSKTVVPDSLHEPVLKTDSAANQLQVMRKLNPPKNGLQWRIVSRIGISNQVAPFASGFGMKSLEQADMAPGYSSGGITNSNGIPWSDSIVNPQPAAPAQGVQITIGAQLKKAIGRNVFIITGLQYSFYSSRLDVGTEWPTTSLLQSNQAIPGRKLYFANGAHNRFNNQFHVIEFPLGLEYRLLRKYPLYLQHGLSIGQLIDSKVLQYDYRFNTFYLQETGLHKTGVNLFSAATYTFWKNKVFSAQAGPYAQYGLQRIFKNMDTDHLLSGGVQLHMSF